MSNKKRCYVPGFPRFFRMEQAPLSVSRYFLEDVDNLFGADPAVRVYVETAVGGKGADRSARVGHDPEGYDGVFQTDNAVA